MKQKTIKKPVEVNGLGLHTGKITTLKFLPAPENTGIRFRRSDLGVEIPAIIKTVVDTQRSTTIGISRDAVIWTIEHILASAYCLGISNLIIESYAPETPLMDGSAREFVDALISAEIIEQNAEIKTLEIDKPIYVEQDDVLIIAIPCETYKISYTMSYSNKILGDQFYTVEINQENFINEICSCRTFALYSEIENLIKKGLIKGGSLDNAIIITDNAILSKDGLRFQNEFVRHKIMDMIGDLSLIGCRLKGHIISIKSGHSCNVKMAHEICRQYNILS